MVQPTPLQVDLTWLVASTTRNDKAPFPVNNNSLFYPALQLSLQLLAGKAAPPSTAGLLADTLHFLAAGLEDAPQRTRKDLSLKLLLLFSEVATDVGGSSGVVRADLGDLLVAVAVGAEDLDRAIRLLGGSSGSMTRMTIHDIQVKPEAHWPMLAFSTSCRQYYLLSRGLQALWHLLMCMALWRVQTA